MNLKRIKQNRIYNTPEIMDTLCFYGIDCKSRVTFNTMKNDGRLIGVFTTTPEKSSKNYWKIKGSDLKKSIKKLIEK